VNSAKRISLLPNVPTMIETGVPNFDTESWHAVYAPRGTPKAFVDRVSAEISIGVKSPVWG
jgi:tripartite-type tricarboxylate transporter receptor subunit TctC